MNEANVTGNIVVVGFGNMGRALVAGWMAAGVATAGQILIIEPGERQRQQARDMGITALAEFDQSVKDARPQLVLLAIKPQLLGQVAAQYAELSRIGTTFASIAAGISIGALEAVLGTDASLVRIMPNMPAMIEKGVCAVYFKPNVTSAMRALVEKLIGASGVVTEIPDEAMMDAVTAVSGSGPAYVFHFIECLTDAAVTVGLPPDTASALAIQTVFGAACMAAEQSASVADLRAQVSSPNGTTVAGLMELMSDDRLKLLIESAVIAARDRSIELGDAGSRAT